MWIIAFAALILSFVTGGRLVTTVDRVLVGMFFFGLFVLQFAELLFLEHPDNLLLVHADAGIADALDKTRTAVLIVASLAVAVVIGERWWTASAPRRRALLPSVAGSLCGVLYAASGMSLLLESPVRPARVGPERGAAHRPGGVALGPAALAARARRAGGSVPRARHAARRAAGGGAGQGARRSRPRARVPGAGRARLHRRPWQAGRAARRRAGRPRPSSATAASSACSSTTRRSTTIRSSWRPSRPRRRSRSTTCGCKPSRRTGSPSCAPRASGSSPPATPSGAGSSATSTTGRRRGSCPWRSSCT